MGFLGDDVSNLKILDFSLRFIVIPFNVASIWITITNHQDNIIYGNLEFNNFLVLKYMVCINAVSAGYALFGAVSSWITCLVAKAWLFFVTDQVLAYLMVTSMAAVVELLDLAYRGDRVVSWSEACDTYGKFCTKLRLALGLQVVSVGCFLVLAVISAYRVFAKYEPPFVPSKETEQEMT